MAENVSGCYVIESNSEVKHSVNCQKSEARSCHVNKKTYRTNVGCLPRDGNTGLLIEIPRIRGDQFNQGKKLCYLRDLFKFEGFMKDFENKKCHNDQKFKNDHLKRDY